MRYFRAATNAAYEAFRSCLDASNGFPSADGKTITTLSADCYRNASGLPIVAVYDELVNDSCVDLVTEISEQQFASELPPPPATP